MARAVDPALLAALSAELAALTAPVEGLADLVADHAAGAPPVDRAAVLRRAQSVDEVSQTLWALSRLLGALAREEPAEAALDAVPLAALADRLRSDDIPPARAAAPGAGEILLFD